MELIQTDIVVVGAGPGGYAAAFYAADLGKKVILVERDPRLEHPEHALLADAVRDAFPDMPRLLDA